MQDEPVPIADPSGTDSTSKVSRGSPPRNWRDRFLKVLAKTGNVLASTKSAGIDRKTAYAKRRKEPKFAERWDEALEEAADLLELEARRRAVNGVARPVYQQGKKVGDVQEYSDFLLKFLLQGARPERYRETRGGTNVTVGPPSSTPSGGDVVDVIVVDVSARSGSSPSASDGEGGD